MSKGKGRSVYCYETKQKFKSMSEAARHFKLASVNSMRSVINNPNRVCSGYHFCTDLSIFDNLELYSGVKKSVYCYETKERFDSLINAAKSVGFSTQSSISDAINNPNRTAGGFHWCTDLSIFEGIKLQSGPDPFRTEVYCYETKQKFSSLKEAAEFFNLVSSSSIGTVLNKYNLTAAGYHWCSDLSLFDGVELTIGQGKVVYCYETKQKFNSFPEAAKSLGIKFPTAIHQVINKPDQTAGGYHWCSDLTVFDEVELTFGNKKRIYCYETKKLFKSIAEAARYIGSSEGCIQNSVDNPNASCRDLHFCTDLSIFDGVELTIGNGKEVFCYETKQKFNSIREAAKFSGASESRIGSSINNPLLTSANLHWCTDLSIFDGADLIYPNLGVSGKERLLLDYIKSIYFSEIIENSKKIINPLELDIFIPDRDLAIEFNGNYWHSEAGGKNKNYHIDKTNLCREKGIQLIHIFEHQWDDKSEIFKSVISNKLGLSTKIYARKCKVVELDNCSEFLNTNHLQGNCGSSVKLGLTYNGELVSVMTFGKPRFNKSYEFELLRFCNKLNTSVVGGASKLLNYFEKKYSPKSIISYANLQWSDGNVYKNLGFTELSISEPNYWWTKSESVLTRYQCQKHKLKDLLKDKFNPELSEKENMEKAGYSRLFDCGNMVFVKEHI